jgi:hypothetical protein
LQSEREKRVFGVALRERGRVLEGKGETEEKEGGLEEEKEEGLDEEKEGETGGD